MIAALVRWIGLTWLHGQVRRGLDGVWLDGEQHLLQACQAGPVLVAGTHSSWWDGPLAVWIAQRHGLRLTLVMDADNLERFRFFEAFGALGVRGPSGLRAVLARLQAPGDVVWIFPQGRYSDHFDNLGRGAVWLAQRARCPIVPVAIDYRLFEAPVVRARVAIRPPIPPDSGTLGAALAATLEDARAVERALVPAQPVEPDRWTRALNALWRAAWTRS